MNEKKLIISTINLLDRYAKLYKEISKGGFDDYESYFSRKGFSDEDELIKPKLWVDFFETVLRFPKDEYISEHPEKTGKIPDFIPRDRRLHPFVFEIKGTDSRDLLSHYSQISGYIKLPVKWGVITNMRDLLTFENVSAFANQNIVQDYSFSFLRLYKNYKNHPKQILDFPNTKQFLAFAKKFRFQKVDFTKKIELIKSASPWTGKEELDSDELINTIRKVTKLLVEDAQLHKEELCEILQFDPQTRVNTSVEFEAIACELDKKRIPHPIDTNLWEEFTKSKLGTLESRAFEIYFSRVAYFAMTRILLVRMWEDIGFIDQSLYDGGFAKLYENLNRQIERVLKWAFHIAEDKYSWLYNSNNNYSWYNPSENTVIDVLYEFSQYNLGKLDTDVLGAIYEEYVDRVDRKNKGQYYTPREIIKLIWDRVGFTSDEAFFRYENGKRKPKLIFDPVTGSGGFLVEAARRIQESAHYNDKDFDDLNDIFLAMIYGLWGSELSIFAHYITEINLLIQLTPVIKKMLSVHKHLHRMHFALYTIPWDSLGLEYSQHDNFMNTNKNPGVPILVPLDQYKRVTYEKLIACHEFDYVCGNPPYVGEKGHKELFQSTLLKFPYWKQYHQGKMDYLYFFIILGLKKLKEGGELGFITTSYWLTADGASKLRKYILENALIKEIIDFGETKIFESAPGQHNMVFILEKCSSYLSEKRSDNKEIKVNIEKKKHLQPKIVKVKKQVPSVLDKPRLAPLIEHIEKYIDKKEYSDEYIDVFSSAVKQVDLTEGAWREIRYKDVNVEFNRSEISPLGILCEIDTGIDTAANIITKSKVRLLSSNALAKVGGSIFVISEEEYQSLKPNLTVKEQDRIKKLIGASDIGNRIIDPSETARYLIYLTDSDKPTEYPNLISHLSNYKPILESRAEFKRNPNRKWYALAWPRPNIRFELPKIITPSRSPLNNFILDTDGYYGLSGMFFIDKKDEMNESLNYIFALLNSNTLTFFCRTNFKALGENREYIKNSLEIIPIRRIDFDNSKEVKIHNEIVKKVDSIITSKKKLAEYNKFFPKIRLTKYANLDLINQIPTLSDAYQITKSLPSKEQRILRTHPDIRIEPKELKDFYLSKIGKIAESAPLFKKPDKEQLYSLELKGKGRKQASIIAGFPFVKYLKEILVNYIGNSMDEIKEILIPKDLLVYENKKKEIIKEVTSLLKKIRNTQNQIDKIVYQLYGISNKEQKFIERG